MGLFSGKDKRKAMERRAAEFQTSIWGFFTQEGLPVDLSGLFFVALTDDGVTLGDQTHTFEIKAEQVQMVSYTVDLEEHKKQKGSLVGGVVGGAVFGVAGAIAMGAPREKVISSTSHAALIIKYVGSTGEGKEITLSKSAMGYSKELDQMRAFAEQAQKRLVTVRLPEGGTISL